jgi:hypothetical protein
MDPRYTINVDFGSVLTKRPDDDSVELKHVALNIIKKGLLCLTKI